MSAVDKAFHGLRHMIATGRLGAGERIPPENELCEELGVSRGPLREAVRMLVALRIVEPRHGSGTYVSQLRPEDIIGSLSLTVDLLPLSGLLEVYELRRVLESHVAAQAAARVTPEALKTIFGHIEAMEAMEAMEDPSKISEIDHRFHTAIARIGGNPTLESLLGVFRARSRAYQVFTLPESAEIKRASDEEHRAIATAIANRDPVAAASAAATHVAHTERWLHAFLPPEAGESPSTSS
ncbi:FadR/GntR family transcriptional regulator [Streptomyces sp. V1I1]|jgi:GntR family transcriptional regulator, transcriptional repressor for pyruvate dehydrogenase complex|uniref:FadR/GntR family transcriptional regulator n=1 Tax=Streptomyces sp. V1I1 TaxID=3042272 RepID=UPI002787C2D3|nr:FCD domain-containing protein [Streptomyces sp. V1I1]MDQ0945681.1 GntR family transcriptional repressor for pyruvate dehydrogenase complex [Streptomyces sp. V1I1]